MDKQPKCPPVCNIYLGGEVRHDPSCPFYPESFSKMYDDLKAAKSHSDAVDNVCIKRPALEKPSKGGTYYTNIGEIVWNEQKELWMNFKANRVVKWWLDENPKLFNPSGAAPQSDPFIEKHLARVKELQTRYAKVHEDVLSAAPPLAGPVWVKTVERQPTENGNYFIIGKRGRGSLPFRDGKWPDPATHPHMRVYDEVLEWLDESNTQQLFTREQVATAFSEGVFAAQKQAAGKSFFTEEEYMNTNYPNP